MKLKVISGRKGQGWCWRDPVLPAAGWRIRSESLLLVLRNKVQPKGQGPRTHLHMDVEKQPSFQIPFCWGGDTLTSDDSGITCLHFHLSRVKAKFKGVNMAPESPGVRTRYLGTATASLPLAPPLVSGEAVRGQGLKKRVLFLAAEVGPGGCGGPRLIPATSPSPPCPAPQGQSRSFVPRRGGHPPQGPSSSRVPRRGSACSRQQHY